MGARQFRSNSLSRLAVALSIAVAAVPVLSSEAAYAKTHAAKKNAAPIVSACGGPAYDLHADRLPQSGILYNIARVSAHNFVETCSSLKMTAIHIRARVSNGEGGTFIRGPFAPVVTLTFSYHGKKTGEFKLLFNVPASEKDETHEIDIAGGSAVWEQSDRIDASAAENLNARPTPGTWQLTVSN